MDEPTRSGPVQRELGMAGWSGAEHTELFVLNLPPYASVYLGPQGKLGGEVADRVAGLWRALGLTPLPEPDHLGCLLALYAELGQAAEKVGPLAAQRLCHARRTLLWEHLWSWLPVYLGAAGSFPEGRHWADLLAAALLEEARREAVSGLYPLPAALRDAPRPIEEDCGLDDLLDALVAPVRCGFILTRRDLVGAGRSTGLGIRLGERRFVLKAMLEQDTSGTLGWLAARARSSAEQHAQRVDPSAGAGRWWAERSANTAEVLERMRCMAARLIP